MRRGARRCDAAAGAATSGEPRVLDALGDDPCRRRHAGRAHRRSRRTRRGGARRARARRARRGTAGRTMAARLALASGLSSAARLRGARRAARRTRRVEPASSRRSSCPSARSGSICRPCHRRLTVQPPMSKTLIIAEKPSVAADIARRWAASRATTTTSRATDYVLSSAVGHLLEIGMPEEEEVKRGKWTFAHLPVIPPHFDLKPIEKNENRLKTLLKLIKRKDVDALINACDAGREGELIFRYIVQYAKAEQADPAPVAAVDDPRRDPRRLRAAAQRRDDAAAGRRRRLPLRGRLAGRHQRHARDDRVQLEVRRLPPDDRRPRADADARDPGRARGEDPRVRAARLLGGHRHVPRRRPASTPAAGSTRSSSKAEDDPDAARRARCGTRRAPRRSRAKCVGKPGIVTEEGEADDAELAAALRPDEPAARGQRPLRLLGAHDAVARAGALREAQGAHLSANRFARAAGGLPRHGERRRSRSCGETNAFGSFAREILKQKWVRPNKRIFDNAKISDHFAIIPTLVAAQEPERGRAEALRHGRPALPGGVLSRRRSSSSPRASRAWRASRSRPRARCW